ncbi:tRNA (N6-threonylcarbamoyladenosine(37)-N6)-methyltransferase TrmO [Acinetobacter qingfengensis]|uniref:tRNA (N6-threonylcarbamoyladenosine(37)-N6)-methyltransferase TrmO n=1 Tax=Acinetobacter qingfengensis TaxID=1262585 RepID=A0A1E7REF1_9GAMM|nr:tRNA (N6-threonylcarbamoyladenosine(37)-N6)-methyltransferase TrmO [Acinetobacter qingfengensis]KAA8735104.1 tRNA (N6-threonylcarbamoyladenosine(37)-N6)-methyltransferase TrmO [Acinetobacter qingfengensis]OEY97673.1 tRNA (N6-threonylcarbamoyladenosine(37)-N6)-methyltransferase TrmO [Acinetobacter qingfengensis]
MNKELNVPIIGVMHSPFKEKFGIPRQPNLVNSISYIEMFAPYDDLNAFVGLEQFSHIWLIWQFHENKRTNQKDNFQPLIRPPRLGGNKKMGVFASRSMYRPSTMGLSVVKFLSVQRENKYTRVYVSGADLLHGTPIIDIKPYLAYVEAIPEAISGYAQHQPEILMVSWSDSAQSELTKLLQEHAINAETLQTLEAILAQNPKPAYQQKEEKVYGLSYANFNIKFHIAMDKVIILSLQKT